MIHGSAQWELSNSAKPLKSCVVKNYFCTPDELACFLHVFIIHVQLFLVTVRVEHFNWLEESFLFFLYWKLFASNSIKKLCRERSSVLSKRTTCNNKLGVLFTKQQRMFLSYSDVSQMFMSLQLQ